MTLQYLTALQGLLRSIVDGEELQQQAECEFQNPGRWGLTFPASSAGACVEPRMLGHPDLAKQEGSMKVAELATTVRDAITVNRVFAEPYEKDGVTVIAAATVAGAGGGGGGHDDHGQEGEGGGFGVSARPAGAYVIKDGRVRWRPAVDVNRLLATIGAVAIAYLLTRARIEKARAAIATSTPARP
jgi:uncharacterized spore protein YtfJ